MNLNRRSFLKMAALSSLATPLLGRSEMLREAKESELSEAFEGSKKVRSVCTACSVGCGIVAEVQNGVWVRQEIAQDHPVSFGGHCCKGSDMIDMVRSHVRLKYPMKKENGEWKCISYEQAFEEIGEKLATYRKQNPESVMFIGSAKMSNEQAYYVRKFAAFFGTNNIDHQARI